MCDYLEELKAEDLEVKSVLPYSRQSPLLDSVHTQLRDFHFVEDTDRVRAHILTSEVQEDCPGLTFERAGPRENIAFDPRNSRAAIVTCGGLCPGLNDVIRALWMELHYWYGVRTIYGVRFGYNGLLPEAEYPPMELNEEDVEDIHRTGGTILGSSRGHGSFTEMVDTLHRLEINMIFCIGGDGTLRGAHVLHKEITARNLSIAVVGIPKTIDNDIPLVYRSFGFQTAVEEAREVLSCAHVEAKGARRGVGLVKLMGRHSGFIAAHAALASGDVNYCLIPEINFPLEGPGGFVEHLRERLKRRNHAVIALAEGAGQDFLNKSDKSDKSGNAQLGDIGLHLKNYLNNRFAELGEEITIKYFDPSYIIRSVPANSEDSAVCADLARHAVHAGMAGKTDLLIGFWHGLYTHVPLKAIDQKRKQLNPRNGLWMSVLATTGQPPGWI